MPRPNKTLPEQLAEPMFCKGPDDFVLMVLQIIKAIWIEAQDDKEPDDILTFLSLSAKIICHEYLACVLSELIEPYTFSVEFKNNEYEDFHKVILDAKADAIKAGVPMVEKDGKFVLDTEEISKRARLRKEENEN